MSVDRGGLMKRGSAEVDVDGIWEGKDLCVLFDTSEVR
ncbi:hypothetical protein Plim_3210 [Planctopirus limnophila DSM 3776]|uniref:Uncharacterized protein n=1 Tax=Planctopirus limnophila (strain ATCC 43296 / DSM 3776 / IFAM 1008 / Mu 290) TaxID=521674 RepID=D5STJ5_PLAL2|nr:hypothetical protein Plim_3210 [Planctopirus limnophila DSM 3776]